jgi:hypothetical protein
MAKNVILMSRRADISRPAFQQYYEECHAKLAAENLFLVKYLRNHVTDVDGAPIDFDCLTEFYPDTTVPPAPMEGQLGPMFAEDESRFCDRPLIRTATSVETLLAGIPREVDPAGTQRVVMILKPSEGSGSADFLAAVRGWADSLDGDRIRRITLDVTTPMKSPLHDPGHIFPFGVFVSLWPVSQLPAIPAPPSGISLVSRVMTVIHETSLESFSGGPASNLARSTP